MVNWYEILKNDALLNSKRINELQITTAGDPKLKTATRFVTQSITSVIEDLIQCIYLRVSKREKRIKRLTFLVEKFNNKIDNDVYFEAQNIINKNNNENYDKSYDSKYKNDEKLSKPSFELLQSENEKSNIESTELIFEKFDINNFKIPEKTIFNNFCKDILNDDGSVYDIFTYVIIISFYNILRDASKLDNTRSNFIIKLLLSDATVVFKGGSSIGKFLFISDLDVLGSLTREDKIYIYKNFINGGDNDTSINFNLTPNADYSIEEINNEIKRISFEFVDYLYKTIEKYKVKEIIKFKLSPINGSTMEYDNKKFIITPCKTKSYTIVEKSENNLLLLPFNDNEDHIYITKTEVVFPIKKDDQRIEFVKFNLTRVKACYLATYKNDNILSIFKNAIFNNDFSFKCYAECLDISFTLVDSAIIYKPTYIDVTIV